MSSFSVEVRKIKLEKHPDPEVNSIELALVDGYVSIVKIGQFQDGDLAVYIPEQAVVPENILEEMNLVGALGGGKKNIVKPRKLRGVFSQGLLYPAREGWVEGQEVGSELGIVKYEIPEKEIPERMRGKAAGESLKMTVNFDIENIKKYKGIIEDGEEVVVSEKIHGCLSSESKILLPDGSLLSISEIISSEDITSVISFDVESSSYIEKPITGKSRRKNIEDKQWIKLTLENGNELILTSDHPIYSRDRKGWIEAGSILENEDIESPCK